MEKHSISPGPSQFLLYDKTHVFFPMKFPHAAALLQLVLLYGVVTSARAPSKYVVQERSGGRYIIADRAGRERIIRGVNLATLGSKTSNVPIDVDLYVKGKCPSNDNEWYQPPICEEDVAGVKHSGFDAVRLLVHWSQLEPSPGKYDDAYIRRMQQILSWAERYSLDVLIDFHQDNFAKKSTFCCADDGAPAWAWLVNDTKLTEAEKIEIGFLKKFIPQLDWSGAEVAFQAFWTNVRVPETGIGLQVHYIQAVAALVRATANSSAVIGYELMNEPLPGLDINLFHFASSYLYPFYARIIQAVTGVRDGKPSCPCNVTQSNEGGLSALCRGVNSPVSSTCSYPDLGINTDKLILYEPTAVRNQLDVSVQRSEPFTAYSNIVYAPHTYTQSFTLWKKEPFFIALDTAAMEAAAMKSALMVTEFGGSQVAELNSICDEQEKHLASTMHWVWKQNGGGGWGLHSATAGINFTMRMDRLRAVSRIRPRAVAGRLLSFHHYEGGFWMKGSCENATTSSTFEYNSSHSTEIYIPVHFASCADTIISNGTSQITSVTKDSDGSKTAFVTCQREGLFAVTCTF